MNYDYYWLCKKYPDGIDFGDFLGEFIENREKISKIQQGQIIMGEQLQILLKRQTYLKELAQRCYSMDIDFKMMDLVAYKNERDEAGTEHGEIEHLYVKEKYSKGKDK